MSTGIRSQLLGFCLGSRCEACPYLVNEIPGEASKSAVPNSRHDSTNANHDEGSRIGVMNMNVMPGNRGSHQNPKDGGPQHPAPQPANREVRHRPVCCLASHHGPLASIEELFANY